MPGPNRAPRGGYQKPKDLKKTVSRLLGYLTRSKLPLLAVLAFLLLPATIRLAARLALTAREDGLVRALRRISGRLDVSRSFRRF